MKRKGDLLIVGVILALCVYAVWKQVAPRDADAGRPPPLEIGEVLERDLVLEYIGRPPLPDKIGRFFGKQATVFMTWSIPCPCIDTIEERMRMIFARYGKAQGVSWVAVDGEPLDKPEAIMEKMHRLKAFYTMLLDPEQKLVTRLGLTTATQVAIVDGEGRLRYRGAIDPVELYEDGDAAWVAEALAAVLAGQDVPVAEREHTFGCEFNDPASCLEYEELESAKAAVQPGDKEKSGGS